MLQAVITADIVNSTRMNKKQETQLLQTLEGLFADQPHEFFRGDSFQVLVLQPALSLQLALLCRTAAIALEPESRPFDIRMGIGIGYGAGNTGHLWQSKEEAFILSGRAFDTLAGTNSRMAMAAADPVAAEALQVISLYLDAICAGITGRQAATVHYLLQGQSQQAAAQQLQKSPSTIHQHLKAARWPEMQVILQHYQNIITLMPNDNQ
ncbi:hypothetical protein [Parafilimonas sp.]|uniref:hypothetical protein n=1 Tax=Parafilimonas sp. TaxID=1969739 RepID=UPI0039E575CB